MNSREVSFLILEDIIYEDAYSNLSINHYIKKYDMYEEESFIRELVFGVLENKIYIDYVIGKMSNIKKNRIHKHILTCLRLGIYQIGFLDNVPDRASIYETVEIAKKYGNKGSIGFVNGVLRNVSRKKEEVFKIEGKNKKEYLSIKYSHPLWLVEYFIDEFGYEFTEGLLKSNNDVADFNIRVNNLNIDKLSLKNKLKGKGYNVLDNNLSKDSLVVENPRNMVGLEEYKNGLYTIQDQSSSLVGNIVNPSKNSLVLDLCAAPGGKTTHMAEIMENKGKILARDIHSHRLKLIKDLADRLKIDIIETEKWDASNIDERLIDTIDYCLVDAPCSGLGTIRRSPEIKYKRNMKDIESLSNIQYQILDNAKNYVKIEGYLIYSTCTIGSKENDNIINKFLMNNKNFILEYVNIDGINCDDGFIKLYPNIHNTDGFFIAKLKRID